MVFQSKDSNYKFHHLLIYIISLLYNSDSKNIKLSLINNESQIIITFANKGNNFFLSSNYIGPKPSSISVNSPSSCNIVPSFCNINDDIKNISLNYEEDIEINSCSNMFKGLTNIVEIDLSNYNTSQVKSMAFMFAECNNLKKITFGNMDTSKVENMEYFLYGCYNLESVDVFNFNTSSVVNMKYMFSCLHSLVSLKLSNNFNTSKVIDMGYMFYHMRNLTSIDISMFDTSQVIDMAYMFFDAEKLKSLNISNFNISKVNSISKMFGNCNKLQYLDIKQFNSGLVNIYAALPHNNKDIKFCVKDIETINYLSQTKKNEIICSETCMNENNTYIDKFNSKCVQSCDRNLYEYENFCYEKCPNLTIIKNNPRNECISQVCQQDTKICITNTPEGYYFDTESRSYKECFENCKSCHGQGDEVNNNCLECKSGFKSFNVLNDIYNCYEICPSY